MIKYPHSKDPNDVLDYAVDWAERLTDAETIETSVFEVLSGGLVIQTDSIEGTKTVFWVEAGDPGVTAAVLNRITTTGGRQWDQTVGIKIKQQ